MRAAESDFSIAEGRSTGTLEGLLREGHFVVTAETSPPDSASPAAVLQRAICLKGVADAVNVTDSAGARAHMSAFAAAAILAREGIESVLQFTVRDRNRLALQGDLIGAAAMGIPNILCLHGDSAKEGDQPDAAMVYDLDSPGLIRLARELRDKGILPSGRRIDPPPRLFIGAAELPHDPEAGWSPDGLRSKIAAGADFFQTQYCFDLEVARRYFTRLSDLGLTEQTHFLVGIGPLGSARAARWMNDNLYGVHIPEEVIKRLEGARDQREEGRRICIELIGELQRIGGVAGVHLMAPRQEKMIAEIIAESGIRDQRVQAA